MKLLEPLPLGLCVAPNRVMFGPHVTNLGDDRQISLRHVAYYRRRAQGGCGVIVTEGASVHGSDWPYERAPLAERCGPGWAAVAEACHDHGSLVVASLDHAGGQGSSAYSQRPLWAPSRVPEVATREVPKWMEDADIAEVLAGFATAGRLAVASGCDGVEINAGQHSLIRQFLSGLTNQRVDRWGAPDASAGGARTAFAHEVIATTRRAIGPDHVLGLRLSCDELAPWAGLTPDLAPDVADSLTALGVDYLVVVRGSIYSAEQTRPDFHQPEGFNIELARRIATAITVPVIAQGSIVDPAQAEAAVDASGAGSDGPGSGCAGVEMTRAQIADPDLVAKLRAGAPEKIRPCTRCNQQCQVRDVRNPIVSCVGEPSSGRETEDPDWYAPTHQRRRVAVVGGGVAGLEVARVASARGHDVTIYERSARLGGMSAVAGPNRDLVDWLERSIMAAGVAVRLDQDVDGAEGDMEAAALDADIVVQCTGGRAGVVKYDVAEAVLSSGRYTDVGSLHCGLAMLPADGVVVLFDPVGGPIAVALAEQLGSRAVLVTQDHIAGNELSRTGDLAPANTRLARAGVRIERRSLVRSVRLAPAADTPRGEVGLEVVLGDRFTGVTRTIGCAAFVDCGFRLPTPPFPAAVAQVGDCVAPRTVYEAILEARRVALAL